MYVYIIANGSFFAPCALKRGGPRSCDLELSPLRSEVPSACAHSFTPLLHV